MRRLVGLTVLSVALLAASGCIPETVFRGSATVTGGPAECRARCEKAGLAFAGMVMMGEYTNGCICRAKGDKSGAAGKSAESELQSSAEAGGAVAAKAKMTQDEEAAASRRNVSQPWHP